MKSSTKYHPLDILLLIFYAFNLFFNVYLIDIEQVIIPDANHFTYPVWPPKFMIDLTHWYGHHFDPALIARPAWWRAAIWVDVLFLGPFYAVAIYAHIKKKNWIRMPTIMWACVLLTEMYIIIFEELKGVNATPEVGRMLLANAAWVIFPILALIRMLPHPEPFSSSK